MAWFPGGWMLIVAMADVLTPQLMPKYRAAIDQRVYDISGDEALLIGIPDVTVGQQSSAADPGTVAVMPPPASPTRGTVPVPIEMREPMALTTGNVQSHYRILVSRAEQRPQADLYVFNVQGPHPPVPVAPGRCRSGTAHRFAWATRSGL